QGGQQSDVSHPLELEVWHDVDHWQRHKSKVNAPLYQGRDLFLRRQIRDGHIHHRESLAKRPDRRRQKQSADRWQNGHIQLSSLPAAGRLRQLSGALHVKENLPRFLQKTFAGRSQGELAVAAIEQLCAQFILQIVNLSAQRRL